MIRGMHALIYSPQAEELRAFFRDKLELPYTDTGGGWLIFDVPEADLGCHPSDKAFHQISFYCDDIEDTVESMKSRGVEFTSRITDQSWGRLTHFLAPGGMEMELFEPKYRKAGPSGSKKKAGPSQRRFKKTREPTMAMPKRGRRT